MHLIIHPIHALTNQSYFYLYKIISSQYVFDEVFVETLNEWTRCQVKPVSFQPKQVQIHHCHVDYTKSISDSRENFKKNDN